MASPRAQQVAPRRSGSSAAVSDSLELQQVALYDVAEVARWEEQTAREQAELEMIKAVLGSVFSVRKPRDFIAGTSSGLKTVARGVGLGLASLVAQPYIGAKTGGARGFVKGVGAGVVTCAASAVTGTVVGTGQIVRGVVNTPSAVVQRARGQVWNSERRVWEQDWYSLPEEAAEVLGAAATAAGQAGADEETAGGSASSGKRRSTRKVADRTLYDLLGVEPDASEGEVRRAFYKKSLALHPDKNPNNPAATTQFQAVSDAYRVLGDEDRRRAYDEHGQDSAAAGLPKIEPAVFFAALFGSHHFEPYIGRLRLAQDIDGNLQSIFRDAVVADESAQPSLDMLKVQRARERMKALERERQVRLALALVERMMPYIDASALRQTEATDRWETEQAREVARLSQVPCGAEMLYVVGWVYANRARQFFAGGVLRRVMAKVEGQVHLAQTKAKLAGSVGRTCFTINGIMKSADKKKHSIASSKPAPKGEVDPPAPGSGEAAVGKAGTATPEGDAAPASSSGSDSRPPGAAFPNRGGIDRGVPRSGPQVAGTSGFRNEADQHREPSSSEAGDSASDEFPVGSVVMVRGLRTASELNGEVGMVCGFDASSGRYLVQVLPDLGLKKFRRDNLVSLQAPDEAHGMGASSTPEHQGGSSSSSAPPPGERAGGDGEEKWAPGGEDADMADAFKDCMPLFHDAFWSATALDIEFTLDRVIAKVLRDMSVDKPARRRRAEVLLKLGVLFQEPLKEKRQRLKEAQPLALVAGSAEASGTGGTGESAKRSMLMRFKPRAPWRSCAESRRQKARDLDAKQKRMEAALAMMAAGASTEDVDEMAAARAAMEAEMDSPRQP